MTHISLVAVFNAVDEILLLKRPIGVPQGGLWSFPGGKVESGEMPLDTARRELLEETGLSACGWKPLGECEYGYPDANLHFHLFSSRCQNPEAFSCPEPHKWVSVQDLGDYPMPQANIEILNPMVKNIYGRGVKVTYLNND
ncbi:MAG: NUDIX domain-containing protein [Mariprofundus sp.]